MKNRILSTMLATAAIATMGIATSQAGALDAVAGKVKFSFDGFDAAQQSYTLNGGTIGTTICTTVAECDAAATFADAPGSNQANDTWGITQVLTIKQDVNFGPLLWTSGEGGDFLFTYFHGFNDVQVNHVDALTVDVFSEGGMADVYRVDAAFIAGLDLTNQQSIEDALAGYSKYLELTFQSGCSLTVATATLCGTFDQDFAAGVSNGSAMATGGDALTKYPYEFKFEQSVAPCDSSCDGTSFNLFVESASAKTTALPEPGALGLLGLGLVGLGLAGRRRKASV